MGAIGKRTDANAEMAAHRKVLDATIENLAHAFGEVEGWQSELEADPMAFGAKWTARIEEASQNTQGHESGSKQLADIKTQQEVQAYELEHSTRQRDARV